MTMKRHSLFSLALFLAAPLAAHAQSAPPPLTRAEILGRLATGSSPSLLAHFVKTRGINFSTDYHFLDAVARAGGNGLLYQRLSSADPASTSDSPASTAPFDHLARCAEFLHLAYPEKAEPACRAAIDENPSSPWPILAALHAIPYGERSPETEQLARRALSLAPDLPESHDALALALPPGQQDQAERFSELTRASTMTTAARNADPLVAIPPDGGVGFRGNFDGVPKSSQEAESVIQQLLSLEPDFAPVYAGAADYHRSQGQLDRAVSEARKALELEPDNPQFHQFLSELLLTQDDKESALAELREAVRCAPYDISRRIQLAGTLNTWGRLAEALKEYDDLIKTKPADWEANNQVTDFLVQQKMLPAAIADIRLFLKATMDGKVEGNLPDTPQGIRFERQEYLARLLQSNGQLEESAAEFTDLLSTHSDDANLHDDYGVLLFAQHKLDEAAAEFREALRLEPDYATAHNNLALCLVRKKDFDAAIDHFRSAVASNPHDQRSRALLGMAYASKGDFASAISEIDQAIRENEQQPEPHAYLARVYILQKNEPSAISELKRALELQPDNSETENEYAWLLVTAADKTLRNPALALRHAEHAVSLLQQAPQARPEALGATLDTLAEAQLQTGHPAEALADEEKAVKLAPNNAEIQSRLQRFRDAAAAPPKAPAAQN
jgi:tetratricopeptide (TPR) repeat protein